MLEKVYILVRILFYSVLIGCILLVVVGGAAAVFSYGSEFEKTSGNSTCNAQIVYLNGFMDTSSNIYEDGTISGADSTRFIADLDGIANNEQIKSLIVSIDSGGGVPVAGSEIERALARIRKPKVAWVRSGAASAAYWASLGTDQIIANPNSLVGSIGVTASYLDRTEKNKKEGLTYQEINSGKFKESGNPDKPLSAEEKENIQKQVNTLYENFIKVVSERRGIPIEEVRKLADGSTFLANDALSKKLVDKVGDIEEVKSYLKEKTYEDTEVCWN